MRKPRAADHDAENIRFAWSVHAAQEAWTAKVDVKASIVLAITGAALFAVLSAQADGGVLQSVKGVPRTLVSAAVAFFCLSLAAAAIAVFPLLGPRRPKTSGLIYFGHLRHRSGTEVASEIHELTTAMQRDLLGRQLVNMAKRNWLKHRLLQISIIFGLIGGGALIAAPAFIISCAGEG